MLRLLVLLASLLVSCSSVDPDTYRTICGIVLDKRPNYNCDTVNITTADGYILQTFRFRDPTLHKSPRPVLLWHGLMDNCFSWVMNMPGQSLSYLLADQGYEVWLGNSRGTMYGRGHTGNLSAKDEAFWQFTWDQFASHDVPATVSHIRAASGADRVGYVGHSQGTIQMFAALSSGSIDARHIAFFGAMGPVIVASHQKDPIWDVFSSKMAIWLGRAADKKEFTLPLFLKSVVEAACLPIPRLCVDTIELFVGEAHGINKSRIEVMTAHEPGGTSTLNMAHWAQLIKPGLFRKYDYGKLNPQHYNGSHTPPLYNITAYPSSMVPTAILSGSADVLADQEDVQYLLDSLPPANDTVHHKIEGYGHMDFLWDVDAVHSVYRPILLPFINAHMPPPPFTL